MPVHRRFAPMHREQMMRESVREVVEVGEVERKRLHRAEE
jgi:hypothetical protein